MKIEEIKNNTYFDSKGKQILVGDLLKVFHFRSGKRNYYMYHVVVMEQTENFQGMAIKSHYSDKPHCRMFALCNNENRIYKDAIIIGTKDWETKRNKIKIK